MWIHINISYFKIPQYRADLSISKIDNEYSLHFRLIAFLDFWVQPFIFEHQFSTTLCNLVLHKWCTKNISYDENYAIRKLMLLIYAKLIVFTVLDARWEGPARLGLSLEDCGTAMFTCFNVLLWFSEGIALPSHLSTGAYVLGMSWNSAWMSGWRFSEWLLVH
jgi:hypothetical protein